MTFKDISVVQRFFIITSPPMFHAHENQKCELNRVSFSLKLLSFFIFFINLDFLYIYMHLAKAFMQRDLCFIKGAQYISLYIPWVLSP